MRIETRDEVGRVDLVRHAYAYPEPSDIVRAWWEARGGGITFAAREHHPSVTVYLDEEGFRELGLVVDDVLSRMADGGPDGIEAEARLRPMYPEVPRRLVVLRWVAVAFFLVAVAIIGLERFGWIG